MLSSLTLTEGALTSAGVVGAFADALAVSQTGGHVVRLHPGPTASPVLIHRQNGPAWRPGPYVGELTLDGARLVIEPRMGWRALSGWVGAATDLSTTGLAIAGPESSPTPLVSLLWVRAVDGASRHGPPAFRRDISHTGGNVRGHLDVRRTVRLRAKGASGAASVYRARDLDNPVTRIIVAADRALVRQIGHGRWRTDRVDTILPQLYTAVGRRSRVPGDSELTRMRYTPITRPFRWAAEISARIVRQDAIATTPRPGRAQGLLLDLEDIWAGAVVAWAGQARPDLRAEIADGSGRILLRDRATLRATLALTSADAPAGGPLLTIARRDRPAAAVQLDAKADVAARAVGAALSSV